MGYAIVAAGCVIGIAIVGSAFFYAGMYCHILFERLYGERLKYERIRAVEDARERWLAEQEKLSKYRETTPADKHEQEELRSWAEGLSPLYPQDEELRKTAMDAAKLRDIAG